MIAPLPPDEASRLAALRAYGLFDTEPEEGFDRITRLVARILGVPIAIVSLVGEDRQSFKSCLGVPGLRGTGRDDSFCAHAILRGDAFVVSDAAEDSRFADNPLVTGPPHIRFYAGFRLRTPDGHNVGSLCAIDTVPRRPSQDDLRTIRELAAVTVDLMELRKSLGELEAERQTAQLAAADLRYLVESMHGMVFRTVPANDGMLVFDYVSTGSLDLLGLLPEQVTASRISLLDLMPPTTARDAGRSLARAAHERRSWEWEGRIACIDGSVRGLRILARPEFERGEVVRWRGILLDATGTHGRSDESATTGREAA